MTHDARVRQQILSNGLAEVVYGVFGLAVAADPSLEVPELGKMPASELRPVALGALEELMAFLRDATEGSAATPEREALRAGLACCVQLHDSITAWDGATPFPADGERALDALLLTFAAVPATLKDMIAATRRAGS